MTTNEPEVTIVIPCLNEAETLGTVIGKAQEALRASDLAGEIIVVDNGSSDGSDRIAFALGTRVIHVASLGYGNALRGGIDAARGRFIIMSDADDSYDFSDLMKFIDHLRDGYDLVVGNRFRGGIEPTAMPALHRYFGVPLLNLLGRVLHGFPPCRDFHCGLRGVTRIAAERMNLRATGMEFASEMIVKAATNRMRITEIPTTLSPSGRKRPSHLRTWTDGWRHLSLLLRETDVGSAILNKDTL